MSVLDEFADDAAELIEEFGEAVVYKPIGGVSRTVLAVVRRQSPERGKASSNDARPVIDLTLSPNPDTAIIGGINPELVDFARDKVSVPYWRGGTAQDFSLVRQQLQHQSPGPLDDPAQVMAKRNPQYVRLFTVNADTSGIAEVTAALRGIKDGVARAVVPAVNKTLNQTKVRIRQGLTKYLTIKASNLNRRLFVTKATRGTFEGNVRIMGRPIGLINFKTVDTRKAPYDPTGQGVYAQILRNGPIKRFPTAFIAKGLYGTKKGPQGNIHVFERTTDKRFPIKTVRSQRLYDLTKQSPVPNDLKTFVPAALKSNLRAEMDKVLTKPTRRR